MAFEVGGQAPMRLVHEWAASPEGLRLTSTMYVGFGADNALVAAANLITKKVRAARWIWSAARGAGAELLMCPAVSSRLGLRSTVTSQKPHTC